MTDYKEKYLEAKKTISEQKKVIKKQENFIEKLCLKLAEKKKKRFFMTNVCWVHFAVRPPTQQNRRRISFLRP